MFLKLKYYGLLVVTLLFLFSCTHKTEQGEKAAIIPYQNLSRQLVKPVPVMDVSSSSISIAKQSFYFICKPLQVTAPQIAVDTLVPVDVKSIQGALGENRLKYTPQTAETKTNHAVPTILTVRFDNDIFDNTDYYYTNGVKFSLYTPAANRSPFGKLMIKLQNSILLQGFSLTQNIYTPTVPETKNILYGDYPFSGFLTIGQFAENYDLTKKIIVKTSIELGVLGPASMSGRVQASVHEKNPVGWKYQIANTPVINYSVSVEKGIVSSNHFEWNLMGKVEAGTLFDNIKTGTYFRAGHFIPVINGPGVLYENGSKKQVQFWFFIKGSLKLVAYNATLQGSMFNDKSPYVISSSNISRLVGEASVGAALYYGNLGLELENIYNSPEFKGAYDFRYGCISLLFGF